MPETQHYFICALPRSRTTWLANLLTVGRSFCCHDAFAEYPNADDLSAFLRRKDYSFVGDSDSGLMFIAQDMVRKFPKARWVFIQRDPKEAAESYWRYFKDNPYPGTHGLTQERVEEMYESLNRRLIQAQRAVHHRCHEVFRFNELDDVSTVRDLYEWCCPNMFFDEERCGMLQQFQVNIIPHKVTIHPSLKEVR